MDRSQYLTQALQNMGQQPAASPMPGPNIGAMAAAADERKAWEAANPGKSHAKHKLGQMMAGVTGAPSAAFGAIGQLPGAALGGLMGLGAKKVF